LLREAGGESMDDDLVFVAAEGFGDPSRLDERSPETYLGYGRAKNFASPGGAEFDEPCVYVAPGSLRLKHWALSGDWTAGRQVSMLNRAGGRIAFRFHASDVHLVMWPRARGTSVPFGVLVDGEPPETGMGLTSTSKATEHRSHHGSIN
jgi:hypothetical protein